MSDNIEYRPLEANEDESQYKENFEKYLNEVVRPALKDDFVEIAYIPQSQQTTVPTEEVTNKLNNSLERVITAGYTYLNETKRLREDAERYLNASAKNFSEEIIILKFGVNPNVTDFKKEFKLQAATKGDGNAVDQDTLNNLNQKLAAISNNRDLSVKQSELQKAEPMVEEMISNIIDNNKELYLIKPFGEGATYTLKAGKQVGARMGEAKTSKIVAFKEAVIDDNTMKNKSVFSIHIKVESGQGFSKKETKQEAINELLNLVIDGINDKAAKLADSLQSIFKNALKDKRVYYSISARKDMSEVVSTTEAIVVIEVEKKTEDSLSTKISNIANNKALGIMV